MNYNELYVLNTAIDGEDIYSLQKFSSKRMSLVAVELIKDILIEKGYLEDYNTLTTKGLLEVRKIKQFKDAKKYAEVLNMVIGFIDEKEAVLLTADRNGDYFFAVIDPGKNVETLIDTFPELLRHIDAAAHSQYENDTCMSPRNLLCEYKINIQTSFTVTTLDIKDGEKSTKELFFESGGKRFYYDCVNNLLHERDSDELVSLLRKRMEVV